MNMHEIGELIKTQDNRCTDQPMFVVQQEVTDYGIASGHSDDYVWINNEQREEADEEEAARLDLLDSNCEEVPDEWEKAYYRKRWEFVTACFTEQGCKDYLAIDGHNLTNPRIYGWGTNRNKEFQAVRKHLMETEVSA